jgi:O-antigen/teichoic acid export membrane protein
MIMERIPIEKVELLRHSRTLVRKLNDGRGVTASTGTALLARLAASATVIIAMPVALHSLGAERFGAFLLLFGVINWMILGNFGVQSALGRAIAAGDIGKDDTPSMLGSALAYAALTTGATAVAVSAAFVLWVKTAGSHVNLPQHELFVAGFAMVVLSFLQITLQTFEGVQIGNLQIYVTNLTRIAGSVFTFVCLLILPHYWSSMVVFVVALSGGMLLGSVLNAGIVLRQVGITFAHIHRNISRLRRLAVSGIAFLVIGAASLFQTHVPVLVLATIRGPIAAVDFGLFIRLLFVMMSGLSMVTAPLWPAIMSARANADREWIRKSARISGFLVVGAGVISLLVLAPFGGKVLLLWTGRKMVEPAIFQVLFGIYFLQMAWSHYWAVILIGFGRERLVASVLIIEGLSIFVLGAVLTKRMGATGMIIGAVCALAGVSNWLLPLFTFRSFRAGDKFRAEMPSTGILPEKIQSPEADWV